jgi:hypothetical protein
MRKKRDVVDVVDVYAVDAYLESVTPVETAFPIYPRKGFCALPYSVTFDIEYRDV